MNIKYISIVYQTRLIKSNFVLYMFRVIITVSKSEFVAENPIDPGPRITGLSVSKI